MSGSPLTEVRTKRYEHFDEGMKNDDLRLASEAWI